MIAKHRTVASAAALAALAIVAASIPAAARDSQAPSFDTCYSLAVQRGSGPNMGGGIREHAQHKTFMDQCMAGKVVSATQASPAAAKLPADAYASTVSAKRSHRHAAPAR
jgi:hypothetical protein